MASHVLAMSISPHLVMFREKTKTARQRTARTVFAKEYGEFKRERERDSRIHCYRLAHFATISVGYLYFLIGQKCHFLPQNPAFTYPFTYPFLLASDIFCYVFQHVVAQEKSFGKVKKYSQKISFRGPPAPFGSGRVFFCARPMAKHPTDVAVAWWSRPDEPAEPESASTYENLLRETRA